MTDLKNNSTQTFVTSHSPYITEMFIRNDIHVLSYDSGRLCSNKPNFEIFKEKNIIRNFRKDFAEGLLAKGVIIAEGPSDKFALQSVSLLLDEFDLEYRSIDLSGIVVIEAGGAGNINKYGKCFKEAGKRTFSFFDQGEASLIEDAIFDINKEHDYSGIEDLVINELQDDVLERFYALKDELRFPDVEESKPIKEKVKYILEKRKGTDFISILLNCCETKEDLPDTIVYYLENVDNVISG